MQQSAVLDLCNCVETFPQTLHADTHRIWIQRTPVSNNPQKNFIHTSKHGTPAIAMTFSGLIRHQ